MKSASTVVLDDGTMTPTRRHFVRSSLICHLVKKAQAMLEDYADPATKQAALTTAPQKSELGQKRRFDSRPVTSGLPR
jgi:hypothetical protein